MRLIFVGDINVCQEMNHAGDVPWIRAADFQFVLANLEGPISFREEIVDVSSDLVLWNSQNVIDVLHTFNVRGVWLANNHIYDIDVPVKRTSDLLAAVGITSFGAGISVEEASRPLVIRSETTTAKVFAFGWDVIGCRLAGIVSEGVNPLTPEHLFTTIRQVREYDQTSFVVFVMHWNYELELYPQPAHRQLAHDLIREGVDAIIGLHPHVAQGAELVQSKPIVYSLGNWFFPPRLTISLV